ncbi:MAG: hypothetical protein AB7S26_41220 [Sandaracinaceae bacterium]
MEWFKRLWVRDTPDSPLLLRVTEPGGGAPIVLDIEAKWLTSGREIARTIRTADGLCVVPWFSGEEAVELLVRGLGCEARLLVRADRDDAGRVHDLSLIAAPMPTELSPRLRASSMA